MSTRHVNWLGGLFLGLATPLLAGQVPIDGITGTMALPNGVDTFYSGVNKALVKTHDGIDHVTRKRNKTKVEGEKGSLDSLRPGTAVQVHYTVKGIQTSSDPTNTTEENSVRPNDGIVTKVDRHKHQITVAFADGTTETLRLTRNVNNAKARRTRVVVYFPDGSGRNVAHYFKWVTS